MIDLSFHSDMFAYPFHFLQEQKVQNLAKIWILGDLVPKRSNAIEI